MDERLYLDAQVIRIVNYFEKSAFYPTTLYKCNYMDECLIIFFPILGNNIHMSFPTLSTFMSPNLLSKTRFHNLRTCTCIDMTSVEEGTLPKAT